MLYLPRYLPYHIFCSCFIPEVQVSLCYQFLLARTSSNLSFRAYLLVKNSLSLPSSKNVLGVPVLVQQKRIWLGTMRFQVRSLASLTGLRIRPCYELWCRLQTQLGSSVAVALVQAGSHSSDLTPSLGTSICCGCSPKKTKDKKILCFNTSSN